MAALNGSRTYNFIWMNLQMQVASKYNFTDWNFMNISKFSCLCSTLSLSTRCVLVTLRSVVSAIRWRNLNLFLTMMITFNIIIGLKCTLNNIMVKIKKFRPLVHTVTNICLPVHFGKMNKKWKWIKNAENIWT